MFPGDTKSWKLNQFVTHAQFVKVLLRSNSDTNNKLLKIVLRRLEPFKQWLPQVVKLFVNNYNFKLNYPQNSYKSPQSTHRLLTPPTRVVFFKRVKILYFPDYKSHRVLAAPPIFT